MDETVDVRIRCDHPGCAKPAHQKEWSGTIKKYQVGLMAIWFHSSHEGHMFTYWEDGEVILSSDDLRS